MNSLDLRKLYHLRKKTSFPPKLRLFLSKIRFKKSKSSEVLIGTEKLSFSHMAVQEVLVGIWKRKPAIWTFAYGSIKS